MAGLAGVFEKIARTSRKQQRADERERVRAESPSAQDALSAAAAKRERRQARNLRNVEQGGMTNMRDR